MKGALPLLYLYEYPHFKKEWVGPYFSSPIEHESDDAAIEDAKRLVPTMDGRVVVYRLNVVGDLQPGPIQVTRPTTAD